MVERVCHCGNRRGHPNVQEEPEYTTWGWIMLSMLGMTPRPHHIVFRCILCRADLGTSRDPKLLERRSAPSAAAS
jgi:hypothetical protein